jgi:hypothetical protein
LPAPERFLRSAPAIDTPADENCHSCIAVRFLGPAKRVIVTGMKRAVERLFE